MQNDNNDYDSHVVFGDNQETEMTHLPQIDVSRNKNHAATFYELDVTGITDSKRKKKGLIGKFKILNQ